MVPHKEVLKKSHSMLKKIIAVIILIIITGVAYYLISPLFRTEVVDDELPENIITETQIESEQVPSGFEELTAEEQEEMNKQMAEKNAVPMPSVADTMPKEVQETEVTDIPSVTFPVAGTAGHSASGSVSILETTTGTVIRYEDFSTINGPKLNVYLAKDLKAQEYIDLGPIKGTHGNINYSVPDGIDVSEYKYVMYWCVPFRVLFNYAEIN